MRRDHRSAWNPNCDDLTERGALLLAEPEAACGTALLRRETDMKSSTSDQHHLTVPAMDPERLAELRGHAASRLPGLAAINGHCATAVDALTVLHAMASSPETAADALTLLHELQVHQVELDLQAQELQESRAELESALRRQLELYDFNPVGNVTIDERMLVHELNQTGADMLGLTRDEAMGRPLNAFLSAEGAGRIRSAISSVDTGLWRVSCRLGLAPEGGLELPVLVSVGKDPAANRYLMTLTDTRDEN